MKMIGHKFDSPGAPWASTQGTMMRRGERGASGELLSAEQQRRIDDYWRAELERIGCDFPYDTAFGATSRSTVLELSRATPTEKEDEYYRQRESATEA
jgi:hypothetical protein